MKKPANENSKAHPFLYFLLAGSALALLAFGCLAATGARWFGWAGTALAFAAFFYLLVFRGWRGRKTVLCLFCTLLIALGCLCCALPGGSGPLFTQIRWGAERLLTGKTTGVSVGNDTGCVPPPGYALDVMVLPITRLEMMTQTDADSPFIILQLHGGAFTAGMNDRYRAFALRYCLLGGGCAVASLEYRLAPEYPYPCQQEDTLAAWDYLTGTLGYAADHIVVVGDSAGGNLALSLGLALRDAGRALPAGFICMSPWADLSNSGASHLYNATKDSFFGVPEADFNGRPVGVSTAYPDGLDTTDPYLSPSFGDYSGFPPMLIQVGSTEVLLSDSEMVYNNAKAHGVDCTLTVYKNMYHVFQGMLDQTRESRMAWKEVGAFLTRLTGS